MKKVVLIILGLFLLVGCNSIDNTPKMKVEELLNKYNSLSDEVLRDLDTKLVEANVDEALREDMRDLYKKQYKDMEYEILNEDINGDSATVEVKLTVYDFQKQREEAEAYIDEHSEEFMTDNIIDDIKAQKYVIERQNETTDRKEETVTFELEKNNGEWEVLDLNDEIIEKLHGTYANSTNTIDNTQENENNENENIDQ